MADNLRKLAEEHHDELAKNPALDFEKIYGAKYLHEFDRAIQCPIWGYPTEGAYCEFYIHISMFCHAWDVAD